MQRSGGKRADHRMLYVGTLYTPDKSRAHYLVDFELDRVAAQLRAAVEALGLGRADQLIALCDGGNGLEEAIRRNFWEDLLCILDCYHAAGHLCDYAKKRGGGDAEQAAAWAQEAKGILYEQGGTALLEHLRQQPVPAEAAVAE